VAIIINRDGKARVAKSNRTRQSRPRTLIRHSQHQPYRYSCCLGSRLIQTQKAMMAASATAERKLAASLS
jgi:hypothetical protein